MSLAQRAALRSQPPRPLRQPARRRVYPIVIFVVVLVAIVAAAGGFEYYYRQRVFPRVHIATVNLDAGGLSQNAVIAQLGPYGTRRLLRVIALIAPGKPPVLVSAAKLGYWIDRAQTAQLAYNIGRTGNPWQEVKAQATTLVRGAQVAIVQGVDQTALRNYLFRLAPAVNRRPAPGRQGRKLDVATAQRDIATSLLGVDGAFKYYLPFTAKPALPVPRHHARAHHKRRVRKKSS
jgi:hypothetical protein